MKATIPVFDQPPAGSWPAVFTDIEEAEGEYGTYFRWSFEVDVDGETVEFTALSSEKLGSKSKGGRWLKGLRGPGEPGEIIDFDELVGTPCVLSIEENDEGFARLVSVLPAKEPKPPSTPPEAPSKKGINLDDPDPF